MKQNSIKMMKNIVLFTVCIFLLSQSAIYAQQKQDNSTSDRWEKYKAEKVSFLTDNLDLTPQEAQKFWPVYNQMEKERWEAQKIRRNLEQEMRGAGDNLSNRKATELSKKFAQGLQKEADLMVQYNEKFLEILSPQKVLRLYKAENEFRMYMIKKYRDQHRNGEQFP
jgi:Spy/CpxP family protein refolding chaperone